MSVEKKKEEELKLLSKEILEKQIAESKRAINYAQQSIAAFQKELEQQVGVLGYTQHLLKSFNIPSIPEEKKKSELEVK